MRNCACITLPKSHETLHRFFIRRAWYIYTKIGTPCPCKLVTMIRSRTLRYILGVLVLLVTPCAIIYMYVGKGKIDVIVKNHKAKIKLNNRNVLRSSPSVRINNASNTEDVGVASNKTSLIHKPGDWHDDFNHKPRHHKHKKPKHIRPAHSVEAHSILPPHHHTADAEPHEHGPKVVEVLLMGPADIEMMILHLNTLEPVVDHFVVVESDITFQGKRKKLLFETEVVPHLNMKLIDNARIEYVSLRNAFQKRHHNNAYHMERKSRNAGMAGLARIKLHDSDIILVGDVDELPAVSAIKHVWHTFDTHNHEEGHYLMLPAYRWSLHWLRKHADWIPKEECPLDNGKPCQGGLPATAITTWGELIHLGDMAQLHEIYYERVEQFKPLYDKGWHCSSCMSYENIGKKYGAFANNDHRMDQYKETHEILIQLVKGHHVHEDDPEAYQPCDRCIGNAPEFAKKHRDRYLDYEAMLSHPETDRRIPKVAAELLYEGRHHHVVNELPLTKDQREQAQKLWDKIESDQKQKRGDKNKSQKMVSVKKMGGNSSRTSKS
jgi:hypothetical protein